MHLWRHFVLQKGKSQSRTGHCISRAMERAEDTSEVEEESEEEVGLQGRQSRRRDNSAPATTVVISYSNGSSNGGTSIDSRIEVERVEELNKSNESDNNEGNDAGGENGTTLQKNSVYFDKDEGTESTNGFSGMKYGGGVERFVTETNHRDEELDITIKKFDIQKSLSTELNHQHEENLDDENFSSLSLSPLKNSIEEKDTSFKYANETTIDADIELIEEINQEATDLDVEGVLKKQDTHDLYCPNCNSCITRKVILRKRKRKFQNVPRKERRDTLEIQGGSELNANPAYATDDQDHGGPTIAANDYSHDREPDIFRCLSCFSFFIPSGSCFKRFPIFGDSNETENPEKKSAVNQNWLVSIFTSIKRKTATDPGDAAPAHNDGDTYNLPHFSGDMLPRNGSDDLEAALSDGSAMPKQTQKQMDKKFDMDAIANELPVKKGDATLMPITPLPAESLRNGGLVNNATTKPQEPGIDTGFSSTQGPTLVEKAKTDVGEKPDDAVKKNNTGDATPVHNEGTTVKWYNPRCFSDDMLPRNGSDDPAAPLVDGSAMPKQTQRQMDQKFDIDAIANELPVKKGDATLMPGTPLPAESFWNGGLVNNATTKPQEPGIDTGFSSTQGSTLVEKAKTDVGEKPDDAVTKNNAGDSVVIIFETVSVEPPASEREQSIDDSLETGILPESRTQTQGEQRGSGASEAHEWDILKSIVYGGLIESITSLSVVSSAAGAGATTLNILALGLANLIGGLFIMGHNLIELRNDHSGGSSNQSNEQEDKYQELLGRKENFLRHAIAVVLSFLIFGSLPPVVYSFSFRKSDNRDLKLSAVAAASLLCIILLAIGKGHIRKPTRSYIRTVLLYVSIWLMSSGVSYVIGDLIEKLLEKLSLFESSFAVTVPFPQTRPIDRAWASN